MRVIFTERTLYVEVVCYDRDAGAITVSGSRRDSSLDDGDSIQIILDTFRDKQSGFVFGTSPAGQEYDGQVVNAGEGRLGRSTTSRAAPAPGSTGTRISLFFPEKRPFFLENAGVFSLSSVRQVAGGNPAQTELFFSRRIGIGPHGREIPILAGARMSGKVSDSVSIGVLNMQTDAMGGVALANNFTVARVYRDLPNSSQVGALFVNRQVTSELAGADDYNRTYAVDGRWGIGQNGQAWRASGVSDTLCSALSTPSFP